MTVFVVRWLFCFISLNLRGLMIIISTILSYNLHDFFIWLHICVSFLFYLQFSLRSRTPSLSGSIYSPYSSRKVSIVSVLLLVGLFLFNPSLSFIYRIDIFMVLITCLHCTLLWISILK